MSKLFLKSLLSIALYIYIFCVSGKVKADKDTIFSNEVICPSTTIRSIEDFNKLQKCTVVAGYVHFVELDFSSTDLRQVVPSNIWEISEYLLVYRGHGIDSLEKFFPKLLVIRGTELLFDQYALVILENRNLKDIGLVSLLRVLKGSIRIERNPSLCFADTINWAWILGNATKNYFYVVENNKPPNECPLCFNHHDEPKTVETSRFKKCWAAGKFQKTSLDFNDGKKCNKESNCLTSCSDSNCRQCTNYVSDIGCVNTCVHRNHKLAFNRQCVSNCSEWGLAQLGINCVEKCPKNYKVVKEDGINKCVVNCVGNFIVHNEEDLKQIADCSTIEGSLTIELYETDKPIVQDLEAALISLTEITGYLKIVNSPQIISLHFFKNLHTIKGNQLKNYRYAVYVVDNYYLEELWPGNVAILRGCIYFHLNPRLCYEKIEKLKRNFRGCSKMSTKDVSPNSNGERVVCGEDVQVLNTTVTDVNSNAAVIEVDVLSRYEYMLLLGYVYYYKESPFKNATRFESRHGCGRDGWFTDTVLTRRNHHMLKNLKPGTVYAYFVNSLTVLYYPYLADYTSEVQYFQTLPAKPGVVAKLFAKRVWGNRIDIHWWPPLITNGIIDKYILQYDIIDATSSYKDIVPIKEDYDCQCPKLDIESHIPTPRHEQFYIADKLAYKDELMNFLFVKRPESKNTTRRPLTEEEIARHNADRDRFYEVLRQQDLESVREQEEGKDLYALPHSLPACGIDNPNVQEQAENKCVPLEKFDDAIEIPGHIHAYEMLNLESDKMYRIRVRACVRGLENGCGPEKAALVETMGKDYLTLIDSVN